MGVANYFTGKSHFVDHVLPLLALSFFSFKLQKWRWEDTHGLRGSFSQGRFTLKYLYVFMIEYVTDTRVPPNAHTLRHSLFRFGEKEYLI